MACNKFVTYHKLDLLNLIPNSICVCVCVCERERDSNLCLDSNSHPASRFMSNLKYESFRIKKDSCFALMVDHFYNLFSLICQNEEAKTIPIIITALCPDNQLC